ncbi:MAG TPA: NAD-dependent epimerase/dehydratase family protein [Candidatus Methanoperedenaceae archaeon]|nr:NAD-dependent epimerase/dehydratase family protein [Candidatus Methanoperedenaceae archaeon]
MRVLVTGGAGFIGSHLVRRLKKDNEIIVFDNFSSGRREFIPAGIEVVDGDLLDEESIAEALGGIDFVYHLAANPDVRAGASDTHVHVRENILATHNLLEGMRKNSVKNILFTSTSTVYGDASEVPTPENYGPLVPISLYGASKLACEALVTAYCHTFDMRSWILRFANIVGERGTHGIIIDFINKLRKNPGELEILGDGRQEKSYLHVSECVDAMLFAVGHSRDMVNIFNIGSGDTISARRIGDIVCDEMGLSPSYRFTGGARGWRGDVPKMRLSVDKLRALGWEPRCGSEESVRKAARELLG